MVSVLLAARSALQETNEIMYRPCTHPRKGSALRNPENMTIEELVALKERVEALLAERQLEERKDTEKTGGSSRGRGSLALKMVSCGKDSCKKCRDCPAHGPYWYLYYLNEHGRSTSKYLGKTLPPEYRDLVASPDA